MKKILITGENSYIGNAFKKWISSNNEYKIHTISVRNDLWEKIDFSDYDVIIHMAALVHKKEKANQRNEFIKINTTLAYNIAKKAKECGVKQFIFMSTMAVYGLNGTVGKNIVIDKSTKLKPSTLYGISKLKAEEKIDKLNNEVFKVVIIRSPIVYGRNCPGNFSMLKKYATKMIIFPKISNYRSMIYIDNLTEFIKMIIDNEEQGIFFPQNKQYINTSEVVKIIAEVNNKRIYLSILLGVIIKILSPFNKLINKVFGNLVYSKEISNYENNEYCVVDFIDSIKACD